MSAPWVKWYWQDWRSDPCLRMCSLAARGLWAEMLALMQEAVPFGHLLIAGRSPSSAQLAALAGAPTELIPDLLAELESSGVFSRTKEGVIYSRRMVRDERKARAARKNGLKGGNPTLTKQKEISPLDNPHDKGGDITQKLEARNQNNSSLLSEAHSSTDRSQRRRPKKVGCLCPDDWKPKASHFDLAKALGRSPAWVSEQAERMRNWSHANAHESKARKANWDAALSNWLRTTRESEEKRGGGRSSIAPFVPAEVPASTNWVDHVKRFASGDEWPRTLGPAPGYSGCRAPPQVLTEFGFGGAQ